MRANDRLDQFNDEDYYTGGPCPSCRLAINKETGRLKWCMGGNNTWRLRIRLMLIIPAVLLPITIIFIAICRSNNIGKISQHIEKDHADIDNEKYYVNDTTNNIKAPSNYDSDQSEIEDTRDFSPERRTSFVPSDVSFSMGRQKRDVHMGDRWQTFRGNVTSDTIIWDIVKENFNETRNLLERNLARSFLTRIKKKKMINTKNKIFESMNNSSSSYKIRDNDQPVDNLLQQQQQQQQQQQSSINGEVLETLISDRSKDRGEERVENSLADYPSDDDPEAYDNGEIDTEDYQYGELMYGDSAGNSANKMPWHTINTGDKEGAGQSQGESDEGEQGGRPSINDNTWLTIDGDNYDKKSDFHAFWKGEGDLKSIREAQAKMMLKYMDKSVDPCTDFYQYACGNWGKRNPIPKDKAGYDTFEMLRESLDSVLKELLEEPIDNGRIKMNDQIDDATVKAKHLFQSCMNYEILEQRMERPLIELLDELGGWPILRPDWSPEKFDWLLLVAQLRLFNNDILISEWVGPDIRNSDQYVIQFDQTSLGLPTRDYFLQPSNAVYLEAYKNYLIKIATLLGSPIENATVHADELIEFETKLAKITSSPDERRNVSELYQRMSIGELRTVIPQIDWHRYLSIVLARPTNISEPVVVFALQYIQDLVNLLSKTPARTISNYLLWRFVRHRVNNLDDRFQEAKQKFYYILFGREQAPSRWKNCVAQVNSNMGMAVGSMFVRKYFDENSKNDTLLMTQEIQQSFRELLTKTCWIDDETKELASEKVDAMLLRIGYPDFILQQNSLNERYKDVVIRPDKYFENTLNILQHLTRVEQDRLGSPVNKTLWNTAPAVVNAYYSRNKNQIMFPAGILQPPFYHRYFPRSLNYGGIGVVIGHEITHGFDDKGRLFDKDGNLHRWWKDEAIEGFHQRAQCLIDQYSRYTVTEVGMQIDGINTQGENIADNGGIKQAFRAYQRWLNANGDANETLPGITATGKQLFFLNFAQVWCGSMRPEATRNKLKTAVHSPGKFRVIGTLSNSDDFAQVFNCPLGAPMNPVDKCSVW